MNSEKSEVKYWAIIPAAGTGSRMGAVSSLGKEKPKQYLALAGKTILGHTISCFCSHPLISGIVVALSPEDEYWDMLFDNDFEVKCPKTIIKAKGGEERCHSVLNALETLADQANDQDWVLVHDAARPCLRSEDIDYLIQELSEHPIGGLLAVPVRDTMKRADKKGVVLETVAREQLWHALTPQMFKLNDLRTALTKAVKDGIKVTDESSAMEYVGKRPKLVKGHMDNIKITNPEDMKLAEFFINS